MPPATYDLEIYRGDTHAWEWLLQDAGGAPWSVSGATGKAEIRVGSGQPVLAELVVTLVAPNTVKADLDAATSAALTAATARWDLQLTYTSPARVVTVIAGSVKITGDITDSGTLPLMAAAALRAAG